MEKKDSKLKALIKHSPAMQAVLAIFTVLYMISPIDVIPDVMPVIGWLDDAAVLVAEFSSFLMYLKCRKESLKESAENGTTEQQKK